MTISVSARYLGHTSEFGLWDLCILLEVPGLSSPGGTPGGSALDPSELPKYSDPRLYGRPVSTRPLLLSYLTCYSLAQQTVAV